MKHLKFYHLVFFVTFGLAPAAFGADDGMIHLPVPHSVILDEIQNGTAPTDRSVANEKVSPQNTPQAKASEDSAVKSVSPAN